MSKKYFCISLSNSEGDFYLKYVDHITFTNTVGYLWRNEEKVNKRHQEILALNVSEEINSCKVVELTLEQIADIKAANEKVTRRVKGPKADEQEQFKNKEVRHHHEPKPVKVAEDYTQNLDDIPIDPHLLDENGEIDEMYLFDKLNAHCLKCTRACKQSHIATIDRCPQFIAAA